MASNFDYNKAGDVYARTFYSGSTMSLVSVGSVAMGIRVLLPQSVPTIRVNASVWTFLTVSMNIMVTSLISFRLIQMRRSLTRLMPTRSLSEYNYSGVLSILTDSALPLTVFGLGYAISLVVDAGLTNESTKRWQIVNIVFATLYYSFTVS
ncbi:hypothetical protein H1R20_g8366, partial [Candolleomyces eurysporus]